MDLWIAVVGGVVGSALVASAALAVEYKRGRTQARERHLERRLDAYSDAVARAQAVAFVLAEPAVHLSSSNPLNTNRLKSARTLVTTVEDVNRVMVRAFLVSDAAGRERVKALQGAVLSSAERVTQGAGASGIDVSGEAYEFMEYAASVIDASVFDHQPTRTVRVLSWLGFRRG